MTNKGSKSSKLIPFPNRINDGKYSFESKEYQLQLSFPKQNHAIHGLVYNKKFVLKNSFESSKHAKIILDYIYEGKEKGYPFKFLVEISYVFSKKGFKATTKIQNLDSTNIPVGDGWHPYFQTGELVDDLMLKIPAKKKILVNDRMIPTGKFDDFKKFSKLTKINKTNFDTGFIVKGFKTAKTIIFSKKLNLKINIIQETGKRKYNYLQVYIPTDRQSIAIEPMTCNTNAFNNEEGLIILKPKQSFKTSYSVNVN